MKRPVLSLCLVLGVALAAGAKEKSTRKSIELPADNALANLKPGPGVEIVRANCVACHSTDYIVRQPGGDAKRWQAEVEKMIKVFGAPVSRSDAKAIVEYLASAYPPRTTGDVPRDGKSRAAPTASVREPPEPARQPRELRPARTPSTPADAAGEARRDAY